MVESPEFSFFLHQGKKDHLLKVKYLNCPKPFCEDSRRSNEKNPLIGVKQMKKQSNPLV